ncbi:6-carboxytetrahydropterin synthase [Maricurvus nonylphenolicus]|uniref:6-pyruvoyl trahydropterin synthase family protein n=1 Tax=Maricurvus nonylphenolicus TaxID=1008307 RepID=UPI0036F407D4
MNSPSNRFTTIRLAKEYMKFSAAHFTVFSATERERLHGHNFTVTAEIEAPVGQDGLAFNYRLYKDKLKLYCQALDEYLLLPGKSPHLEISKNNGCYQVNFDHETLHFPIADTHVLPLLNSSVEELSAYILNQLLSSHTDLNKHNIRRILINVSSGPGQSGSSEWQKG